MNSYGKRFWVCFDRYGENKRTEMVVVYQTNDEQDAHNKLRELETTGVEEYYLFDHSSEAEEI